MLFKNSQSTGPMAPSSLNRPAQQGSVPRPSAENTRNNQHSLNQAGTVSNPEAVQRPNPERKRISEVLFGDRLYKKDIPRIIDDPPLLFLNGTDAAGVRVQVPLSSDTLGKHLMLLGGIGTGKTNAFNQMLAQLRNSMGKDSVVVIFDTKGDFYRTFAQAGDVVISNDETAQDSLGRANYWNIFRELNRDPAHLMENIIEISNTLFAEACEKSNQPFFPNAARDLFTASVWHFIKTKPALEQTNRSLSDFLFDSSPAVFRDMLMQHPRFRAIISYIQNDNSAQTQGVLSELQQVVRQIFVGNFNKHGTLSLRNLTREKGGRFVFIEYDLSLGSMLTPVYSLMYDLAIKEALCRERTLGKVFFVTDEFRLLPHLKHIDDAVNFGRSLGVKFMIGVQNVEQLYENYGQERARSIMSGFLGNIIFRVNDPTSRQHIRNLFGSNRKKDSFSNIVTTRGLSEETRDGQVVEDWDITSLRVGQAIIGLPGKEPFVLQFDRFDEERYAAENRRMRV